MKPRILVLLAATALLCLVLPAANYAQEAANVTINFPFMAEGKSMPAGQYDLQLNSDRTAFMLTASPKGSGMFLTTITRLASSDMGAGDARVVFDKVGDTYYLSEVWLPGEDGFLVYAAKGKHTHTLIKFHRKAK